MSMDKALREDIIRQVAEFPGHTSIYFKNLVTGESFGYNEWEMMCAASVIKLTIMAELFRQLEEGRVRRDALLAMKDEYRVPISGVLTLMHAGLQVTPIDLCALMIAVSDNVATNMLIDLLGLGNIQENIRRLDLPGVELNRKLFDRRPEYRDKTNYITAGGIGKLVEMIYRGQLVSPAASKEMLDMMRMQQCTNKIPLLLPGEGWAAHKTGEDETMTHDVGVVFAKEPFVVCHCSWKLEPGVEGRRNVQIGQITRALFDACGGEG